MVNDITFSARRGKVKNRRVIRGHPRAMLMSQIISPLRCRGDHYQCKVKVKAGVVESTSDNQYNHDNHNSQATHVLGVEGKLLLDF